MILRTRAVDFCATSSIWLSGYAENRRQVLNKDMLRLTFFLPRPRGLSAAQHVKKGSHRVFQTFYGRKLLFNSRARGGQPSAMVQNEYSWAIQVSCIKHQGSESNLSVPSINFSHFLSEYVWFVWSDKPLGPVVEDSESKMQDDETSCQGYAKELPHPLISNLTH